MERIFFIYRNRDTAYKISLDDFSEKLLPFIIHFEHRDVEYRIENNSDKTERLNTLFRGFRRATQLDEIIFSFSSYTQIKYQRAIPLICLMNCHNLSKVCFEFTHLTTLQRRSVRRVCFLNQRTLRTVEISLTSMHNPIELNGSTCLKLNNLFVTMSFERYHYFLLAKSLSFIKVKKILFSYLYKIKSKKKIARFLLGRLLRNLSNYRVLKLDNNWGKCFLQTKFLEVIKRA